MTLAGIARWFFRRRESKPQPRPSASLTGKEKPTEQHGAGQKATGSGRKRFGELDQRLVDKEIDGFVVADAEDWTFLSDSDDSDCSIGWFEPSSSGPISDTESDNSFAVLVPCYSRHAVNSRSKPNEAARILGMINSNSSSRDSQKYVEKWLASLKR